MTQERGSPLRAATEDEHAVPASEASSIDALYREQRPRLIRSLRGRTSPEHAQDLVQQAFAKFAALGRWRRLNIVSPASYLRQSATNLMHDEARAAARQSKAPHVALDEIEVAAPDQIAALEARDVLKRLESELMRLPARTREIFLAHRIDGYSYAEIAGRTGLSVKCIEKHMSRAIAFVDRILSLR